MSRIESRFAELRQHGRKALIPYIPAGYPDARETTKLMHALVAGGADLVELGVPFSDPCADGPVIQHACYEALQHGMTPHGVLDIVRQFRVEDKTTPVILMGYLNPLERLGYANFVKAAADAGVDGLLIVDLPVEECAPLQQELRQHDLDLIFLLAPTSTEERIEHIGRMASGFVYYVSVRGVTGAASINLDEISTRLSMVKKHTALPVGVGFGISNAKTARQVAEVADAVIIGSAIIRILDANKDADTREASVRQFMTDIRVAIDETATV